MSKNSFFILIVSLILSFSIIIFLVLPKISNILYLRRVLVSDVSSVGQLGQVLGQFNALKAEYSTLQGKIQTTNSIVPLGTNYPDPVLLQELNDLAQCGGLTLTNFTLTTTSPNSNYTQVAINENLSGNYASYQQYLSCVENYPRFFEIQSSQFNAGFSSVNDIGKFAVNLVTFYQN